MPISEGAFLANLLQFGRIKNKEEKVCNRECHATALSLRGAKRRSNLTIEQLHASCHPEFSSGSVKSALGLNLLGVCLLNEQKSTHPQSLPRKRGKFVAFTLVEALIALVIIGVVSAMTLPVLSNKLVKTIDKHQKTVIEKRFVKGLNLYNNLENGLSGKQYETTKDFLDGLSKYYKMSSICDSEHLKDCFPYEEMTYNNGAEGDLKIKVLDLKMKFNHPSGNYLEPAGFISAGGTPFLVSYYKDCLEDPDSQIKDISTCLAGFYDLNGTKNRISYPMILLHLMGVIFRNMYIKIMI